MKCSQCKAECCKFDTLGNEVIENIAEAVHMTPENFTKIFKQRNTKNGYCMFLNDNYKCSIYDERPILCRQYFCNNWEPE